MILVAIASLILVILVTITSWSLQSLSESPQQSLSQLQLFSQPPSPSCGVHDAASADSDVKQLHPDLASNDMNEDPSARGRVNNHWGPDPPGITCVYHPKLDGMLIFFKYILTLTLILVGQICDKDGNEIPLNMPPPPHDSDKGPNNWTPYDSHLQFEVADFLFCWNQMSIVDINSLLSLWATSLTIHSDKPPFSKAAHVYI